MVETRNTARVSARTSSRVVLAIATSALAATLATAMLAGTAGASSSGLNNLQKQLSNESKATYEATYAVVNPGSSTTTMVLAQSPPNSYMKTSGATLVSTGNKTYYCSSQSGAATTCLAESGVNPLAGLAQLFSSTDILTELKTFSGEVADHIPGVSVKTSSKTVAGQPSTCVSVKTTSSSHTETWCVTNSKGVLSYENSGTNSVTLKSYTTSPPASLFKLPSGATIIRTP